jgi:ubiquinone/menaquinone biosynthesis C-methylase UbiE
MSKNHWTNKEIKDFHSKLLVYRKDKKRVYFGDLVSEIIIKKSKKYIGKDILDVGAGSGSLILNIKKKYPGKTVTGIDLVAQPGGGVLEADLTALGFANGSFDTVFCTEVLEHLNDFDLKKGLSELMRVLKKGGFLIVTTPYKENLEDNMVFCPTCNEFFHKVGHQQSFGRTRMVEILEANNFNIIKSEVSPLGFILKHRFLKIFVPIAQKLNIFNSQNLFVVAKK